jgi:hypothetical protein
VSARLLGVAGTAIAFALAAGVFMQAAPLAALLGLGELHLILRLGVTVIALGLFDALMTRLLARLRPHP